MFAISLWLFGVGFLFGGVGGLLYDWLFDLVVLVRGVCVVGCRFTFCWLF